MPSTVSCFKTCDNKLDDAGNRYNVVYLNGLGGKGVGIESATVTAKVLNRLNPFIINIVSLTIFPESQLYQELQDGEYFEEPEIERLIEVKTLISKLNIKTNILSNHISNRVPITGILPKDMAMILRELDKALAEFPEQELKAYRKRVWHLLIFQPLLSLLILGRLFSLLSKN